MNNYNFIEKYFSMNETIISAYYKRDCVWVYIFVCIYVCMNIHYVALQQQQVKLNTRQLDAEK